MLLLLTALVTCADCHQSIVERWLASPMGRSSGAVAASEERPGSFVASGSGARFEMGRTGDSLELRVQREVVKLSYYIGSGRAGRSYAFVDSGYLYQAPVGFYANRKAWDSPPGYERDASPDFSRPISADCLFCHASGVQVRPGTINRIQDYGKLHGIPCERCHGDGAAHSRKPQPGSVVNPAKLPARERDSICEQCHLSGESRLPLPSTNQFAYEPGKRLEDYIEVFVRDEQLRSIRVTSHSDALAASRCKQKSGDGLWCGTCHDPHRPTTDYNARCAACHVSVSHRVQRTSGNCIGCHMPKARASNGGHTVFTDHSILRTSLTKTPPKTEERVLALRPYYRRDQALPAQVAARNLGLAYAEMDDKRAWPLLREAAAAGVEDALLFARIGSMLQQSGNFDQAMEAYRASLRLHPDQFEVVVNLALLLERAGRTDDAANLRRKAFEFSPRPAKAAFSKGPQ